MLVLECIGQIANAIFLDIILAFLDVEGVRNVLFPSHSPNWFTTFFNRIILGPQLFVTPHSSQYSSSFSAQLLQLLQSPSLSSRFDTTGCRQQVFSLHAVGQGFRFTLTTSSKFGQLFTPPFFTVSFVLFDTDHSANHISHARSAESAGSGDKSPLKGDLFMLLAATFFALDNVLQEYLVSKCPLYEVLGQLGLYGIFMIGLQASIFDRSSFQDSTWSPSIAKYMVGSRREDIYFSTVTKS